MRYKAHVIPHTHWDREWYLPGELFRFRLVRLLDRIVERLECDPEFRHFHLDGQTIVLEDYLAIRPDQQERLERLIRDGRIAVGPWYVLPDEFLVSGEALIRNLTLGSRLARAAGAGAIAGYLPDMFGHISQMPQILRGFGFDSVILWRGVNGADLASEWQWEGADGSRVLASHLPAVGYSNLSLLSAEPDRAESQVREAVIERKGRATTRHLLLMQGTDHTEPLTNLPALLRDLERRLDGVTFEIGTVAGYLAALAAEVPADLRVIRGELRDTNRIAEGRWNFVLPGVLSARLYLKQANDRVQRLLERWAEPMAAFAWLQGREYPAPFLWHAWRHLLQNHPHDDIAGCSVDAVHQSMESRFRWAEEVGDQVAAESLHHLSGAVDTSATPDGAVPLVLFNPLNWERTDLTVATVWLDPGQTVRGIAVAGPDGQPVPAAILDVADRFHVENFEAWPPQTMGFGRAVTVAIVPPPVPANGHLALAVRPSTAPLPVCAPQAPVVSGGGVIENEHLRVAVAPDLTLTLTDKRTGRTYTGLHAFEDGGDAGDSYTYAYPQMDRVVTARGAKGTVSVVHQSGVLATLRLDLQWEVPASLAADGRHRTEETVPMAITSEISLAAGARRVDIRTVVANRAENHRLRVLFPTGMDDGQALGDAAFDLVMRPQRPVPVEETVWIEDAPTTYPQQNFCAVQDAGAGLAVISQGLPEWEPLDQPGRPLALTLLRCVAMLGGTPGVMTIASGAGPNIPVPGAQCPGTHEFR
ncbi:MAG: alpha-mannosidase, partial [Mycobacterium leprae]